MKLVNAVLLILLCATEVYAQPGAQIGYNVANGRVTYKGERLDRSAVFTLSGGFLYRLPVRKQLLVEPALLFCRKGFRETELITIGKQVDYAQTRLDYVQALLPVLYKRSLNPEIDLTIGGGLFVGCLVHATQRVHYVDGTDEIFGYHIGNGNKDGYTRIDAGLHGAAGVRIGRCNLSACYDLGMTDISPLDDKVVTRVFSVNIGLLLL